MRILQINTEIAWRGGENQTLLTCQSLKKTGHHIVLMCLKDSPLALRANEAGIETVCIPHQMSCFFKLVQLSRNFDIIHPQTAKAFNWAVLSSFFHSTPLVYTRRVNFKPKGIFTRAKYKKAACVVAISPAVQKTLRESGLLHVPIIGDMISERAPNRNRAEKVLKDFNIPDTKKKVGVVAALTSEKGPLTALESARELGKIRSDFVFLHFGDGPLRGMVEEQLTAAEFGDTYKLMGYYENVEDFFPLFDVFIMCSNKEGLGSSVLEAFRNRVPVASTDAGGLHRLVEGKGLICRINDPVTMSENINKLLNNRQLIKKVTEDAYNYVVDNHCAVTLSQKYDRLYQKILMERKKWQDR